MKSLDVRTMMVMVSMLTLLFSGMLALAGLHAGTIRGMRHWALASQFISLGLGLAITQPAPPAQSWALVCGATFLFGGLILQLIGIKAFKEEAYSWRIPCLLICLVVAINVLFVIISPNIHIRAIANSIVFAAINLACARALLIRIEPPLRTAYWFTGSAFALQSLFFIIRACFILTLPAGNYNLYGNLLVNPAMFFVTSITLLSVTFGFVLMLNYRLATDLQNLAALDVLTGALNRRSLEKEAATLQVLFTRTGETLAMILLDIDQFKSINDTFGHAMGDAVLKQLYTVAKLTIRKCDYFARYGGEEFCILLPSTNESDAVLIAERLREVYAAMLQEIEGKTLNSTVSIGVADSTQTGLTFSSLAAAADRAMYLAKEEGRNRVVRYSDLIQ